MTTPRIHDLLDELANDVEDPHLARDAWDVGARRRHRRRLAWCAASTAVLVLGGGLAINNAQRGPGAKGHLPGAANRSGWHAYIPRPAGHYGNVPIWLGPTLAAEARLPQLATALPVTLDLRRSYAAPYRYAPVPTALAAFAISGANGALNEVILVGHDGWRPLDISQLKPYHDAYGNPGGAFGAGSLSPDGSAIAFAQPGAVVVYDLGTDRWHRYPVDKVPVGGVGWLPDGSGIDLGGTELLIPSGQVVASRRAADPLGSTNVPVGGWWGPIRVNAGSYARGVAWLDHVPAGVGADAGIANPQAVVVADTTSAVLVLPEDPDHTRWKGCCAVASWLQGGLVAYESRSTGHHGPEFRILAWDPRTTMSYLVTQVLADKDTIITGSYADLSR